MEQKQEKLTRQISYQGQASEQEQIQEQIQEQTLYQEQAPEQESTLYKEQTSNPQHRENVFKRLEKRIRPKEIDGAFKIWLRIALIQVILLIPLGAAGALSLLMGGEYSDMLNSFGSSYIVYIAILGIILAIRWGKTKVQKIIIPLLLLPTLITFAFAVLAVMGVGFLFWLFYELATSGIG